MDGSYRSLLNLVPLSLRLCSITAARRMAQRPAWVRQGRGQRRRRPTLCPTSPAMPATPWPWTAWPSTRSPWTSWTRAATTTTAPPALRTPTPTPAPRASQTACATAASAWASTPTMRTRPWPCRCPPTHRAPQRSVTTERRTPSLPLLLPRRGPTAPRCDRLAADV